MAVDAMSADSPAAQLGIEGQPKRLANEMVEAQRDI